MRSVLAPIVVLMTLGCGGLTFEQGELQRDQVLVHDGIERTFHLYESDAAGPRPVVVLLHGGFATIDAFLGASPGGAAPLAGVWLEIAEEEGLHVVLPQGVDKHWNDCRADCDHCPETDDAAFLLALIDHVSSRLDVDPTRVHVVGESNGGFMTQRLAVEHGDRFAGLGVVIANRAADNQCDDIDVPVPMMFVVGTADAAVPYEGGPSSGEASGTMDSSDATLARWATRNACDPEPSSEALPDLDPEDGVTVRHDVWTCEDAALERYVAVDGGHVVPSIAEPVSALWEGIVGPQSHDLETARAMWAFFEAHPSPAR